MWVKDHIQVCAWTDRIMTSSRVWLSAVGVRIKFFVAEERLLTPPTEEQDHKPRSNDVWSYFEPAPVICLWYLMVISSVPLCSHLHHFISILYVFVLNFIFVLYSEHVHFFSFCATPQVAWQNNLTGKDLQRKCWKDYILTVFRKALLIITHVNSTRIESWHLKWWALAGIFYSSISYSWDCVWKKTYSVLWNNNNNNSNLHLISCSFSTNLRSCFLEK